MIVNMNGAVAPTRYELRETLARRRGEAAGAKRRILDLQSQIKEHARTFAAASKAVVRLEQQLAEADGRERVPAEPTRRIGAELLAAGFTPADIRAAGFTI